MRSAVIRGRRLFQSLYRNLSVVRSLECQAVAVGSEPPFGRRQFLGKLEHQMHVALVLLAIFAVLAAVVLSARWYNSEDQFQLRKVRARILPPYKRWF